MITRCVKQCLHPKKKVFSNISWPTSKKRKRTAICATGYRATRETARRLKRKKMDKYRHNIYLFKYKWLGLFHLFFCKGVEGDGGYEGYRASKALMALL